MTDNIYVYCINMPAGINESVVPCSDGYTVYLDRDLDETGRANAFRHALTHIRRGDHEAGGDIGRIEMEAHGI